MYVCMYVCVGRGLFSDQFSKNALIEKYYPCPTD